MECIAEQAVRAPGRLPEDTSHSVAKEAAGYIRRHGLRFFLTSVIVLIPCYWHRWIIAEDLGSHLYNAWLTQLIERGGLSGLVVTHQWSNVLFDLLLSGLSSHLGFWAAEKIAVSLAVLVFFWGAFAFASATGRRAPWLLTPLIAVAAYGWIFNMGFFNYYLSIGLSFWGLALVMAAKGPEKLLALAIAPLVVLAHPLGIVWYAGAAVYLLIAAMLPARYQLLLFLCVAGILLGLHHYLANHYPVEAEPSLYRFNGADQLALFGRRYWLLWPAVMSMAALVIACDRDLWRSSRRKDLARYAVPLQLYAAVLVGVFLIPRAVLVANVGTIGFLTERMTLVAAVLGCAVLAAARPRLWHVAGFGAIAAVFFSMLYADTSMIARMEERTTQLVATLPPGQRVLASIWPPQSSRVQIRHIVDRACIERCFSYGDYEPSSGEFRVRVYARNPYVLSDSRWVNDMEKGRYVVRTPDLPLYEIYQCTSRWTDVCIGRLGANESNDEKTAASLVDRSP